ncbi:hypothetical protein GGR54DRAFT_374385 [Hypoxylon sp. NC1633]|nr:hypothetical protein GGR54DRAFT_374385 [Hypoxylon sp. NC1633]
MASSAVSTPSTPPPPGRVRTPNTPRFGYADSWEPFSPRKSARISAQRAGQRTPSPQPHRRARPSIRSASLDVMSTPITSSPIKKRSPAMDSVRRASDTLTAEDASDAAGDLGSGSSQQEHKAAAPSTRSVTMLPTPAKTPQKRPDEKAKANVRAVARNLFSFEEDVLSSNKQKKTKKYTGLTLDSFTAEDVEDPIEIFTDNRDRIPEVGDESDNPFYGDNSELEPEPEPAKKQDKVEQVSIPGEGQQTLSEALRRDDGIVYVFRGKRFFRKFSDEEEAEGEGAVEGQGTVNEQNMRPLTRSSVKPRLLFPSAHKGKNVVKTVTKNVAKPTTEDDEEAITDIEDHVFGTAEEDTQVEAPATPTVMVREKAVTPDAPKFAPVSPPSTGRVTRTGTKLGEDASPMKPKAKPRSPFDGWRRSKSQAQPHGQKREGEALPQSSGASKRHRA